MRQENKGITLVCPSCRKRERSDRVRLLDPPNAATLMLICFDCDDGDFHAPVYLDKDGEEIWPREPD